MREEEEKRGGEDGVSVYASCGSAPPQATRGQTRLEAVWPVQATHPGRTLSKPAATVISPDGTASLCLRYALSARCTCGPAQRRRHEPCLSCAVKLCRFSAGLVVASVAVSLSRYFTHTTHSQHCLLTQEVLFIRRSDRDLWGARQRAHSKRRLCQTSKDE